jgi:Flp pilus assembly protein TadD
MGKKNRGKNQEKENSTQPPSTIATAVGSNENSSFPLPPHPQGFLQICESFRCRIVLALLLLVVSLTYGHALHSPFVFDDVPNIVKNPHIQIHRFTFQEIKDAIFKSPLSTRPIANLSFALNYFLHGINVSGYRLVNFLIHVGNGFLLFLFLNNILNLPLNRQLSRKPAELAFWATLIWFVHPLHVQSVTYVVQRMNSLASFFYLLTFLCYLRLRLTDVESLRWLYGGTAMISFLLAIGSKEIALTLPLYIFLFEWFFFQDLNPAWIRKNLKIFSVILFSYLISFYSFIGLDLLETIMNSYQNRHFSPWQRILTEQRVVLHYIDLFLLPLPSRLSLLHEFKISTSLFDPLTTLPALLFLNALVAFTIFMARRARLLSFCLLWFFGNLFLESSVIGLEIIFEHRTYLPSMLLGLFFITLQHYFVPPKLHRAILCSLFLLFSFWTYERNTVWADQVALWQDCLQKHPGDTRAYNALGQALEERGQGDLAIQYYEDAIGVDPDHLSSYNNLGIALSRQGKMEEAIENFEIALTKNPLDPESNYNMAFALGEQGYFQDAIRHYNIAHENSRNNAVVNEDVHNNLGILFSKTGRIEEAIRHFQEALVLNPGNFEANNNLAVVYTKTQDYARATQYFQAALRLHPDDHLLHNRLGLALMYVGRYEEARHHFEASLKLKPGFSLAEYNLQKLAVVTEQ